MRERRVNAVKPVSVVDSRATGLRQWELRLINSEGSPAFLNSKSGSEGIGLEPKEGAGLGTMGEHSCRAGGD